NADTAHPPNILRVGKKFVPYAFTPRSSRKQQLHFGRSQPCAARPRHQDRARSRTRKIRRNGELLAALMLGNLQRDVLVLMASRGFRAFAFSYLGVVFAIYLSQLGFSTVTIGLVLSTASASGAVLTVLWGFLSDRFGRKKILMLLAALTVVSNLIYIFFSHLVFILSAVIIANVG